MHLIELNQDDLLALASGERHVGTLPTIAANLGITYNLSRSLNRLARALRKLGYTKRKSGNRWHWYKMKQCRC